MAENKDPVGASTAEPGRAPESPRSSQQEPTRYDIAYPPPLRERELRLLKERGKKVEEDGGGARAPHVGFGLSGGGIRSATFCLGLFQGLAKQAGLLGKIDFLSTVSGGGYFGSFLGRLGSRREIDGLGQVEAVLHPDRGGAGGGRFRRAVDYLRENGRYLSPNGAGDLLLGGAVLFRNWVSIHVVLWSFVLMLFLALQVVRVACEFAAHAWGWEPVANFLVGAQNVQANLWWSPWWILPLLVFVFFVVPLGWAYWLVEGVGKRIMTARAGSSRPVGGTSRSQRFLQQRLPRIPVVVLLVAGVAYLVWLIFRLQKPLGIPWQAETFWAAAITVVISAGSFVHWWCARRKVNHDLRAASADGDDLKSKVAERIREDAALRNELSRRLKTALVVTGVLVGLTLVDSLGQTLYAVSRGEGLTVEGWIGSILAGLTVLSGFARRIAVQFGRGTGKGRVSLPLNLVATVAAILVMASLLVIANAGSHAVAWLGRVPPEVVEQLTPQGDGEVSAQARVPGARQVVLSFSMTARSAAPDGKNAPAARRDDWMDLAPAAVGLGLTLLLSALFGRIWPFVNRSSHHPLYSARLTRAYLGASNPARLTDGGAAVTQVMAGDDLSLDQYWSSPEAGQRPPGHGMPLHLINVTVNETVDGRSQVQQQDRRGTGMALGPAGISLGVRHHVVGAFGATTFPPEVEVFPSGEKEFRAFEYERVPVPSQSAEPGSTGTTAAEPALRYYRGEPLPLGSWVGISGAAFSTGLGSRTSLGLSVLAGLGNVRLGYWWDAGIEPKKRTPAGKVKAPGGLLAFCAEAGAKLFPVQTLLLDELFARFPGTARRRWYLSDGGHFENMAGYELIRRRLPLIVIVDAEADPDYTYGGLSNLVRKARLDFGAEIEFLAPGKIDCELPKEVSCHFGSLEQLRRGQWKRRKDDEERKRPEADFEATDRAGLSLVHAALARVRYRDGATPESRLIYVKPSLFGDEPEDVLDYHRAHPDFPQETTADQFFDEAQWESYRRLGQHIADRIFGTPVTSPATPGTWDPRKLKYRPAGEAGGSDPAP